jgi:hypothetical protein
MQDEKYTTRISSKVSLLISRPARSPGHRSATIAISAPLESDPIVREAAATARECTTGPGIAATFFSGEAFPHRRDTDGAIMRAFLKFGVVTALCSALSTIGCAFDTSEPSGGQTGESDLSKIPAQALYYWDEDGVRHSLQEIIQTDNLYACLEDACIGEATLLWMAGAWVISVGTAWYVTNNQKSVGPFTSQQAAQSTVTRASASAKKKRKYMCTAKCQSNGSGQGAYYVSGTSLIDCGTATLAAKASIPNGEYPRHCSCSDTNGFRGTGTQCESHTR